MSSGFGGGFTSGSFGDSRLSFGRGFSTPAPVQVVSSAVLFSNFSTYITDGTRALHGAGQLALLGAVVRVNVTLTHVIKVTSTITVQGFKFIRTPEASGNWLVTTSDDMDVVLTVKSGGSINGGAISTKTFATNSKVRSATRTAPVTVNSYRTEYDTYTVYDTSAVTLTAGTYQIEYRGVSNQIGVAVFNRSAVAIPTTTSVYPDPDDASNSSYYPIIEILSVAP